MAERRMFAKAIIDSDAFLDMPLSTQALYFHLSMRADDEGFIGNPKRIKAMIGASDDDLKVLIAKRFILVFDSGVVVIKHWRIHNYIQGDRKKETTYIDEKNTLFLDENKAYTERGYDLDTKCIQNGYNLDTQVRLGKVSIELGKDNLKKEMCKEKKEAEQVGTPTKHFIKPSLEEVETYCQERNNKVNAQRFIDFYQSKGWKIGKEPMKDWKACVRTWEQREEKEQRAEKNTTWQDMSPLEKQRHMEAILGDS